MRNFKRTLALVLAVIMVVGTFATVSAADSNWYAAAVDYLERKNIADIGDTAGEKITRNEFVYWVAKIESANTIDSVWDDAVASVVFSDVNEGHHRAAIAYAYKAGYIIGNGDGTFAPDKILSLAEASAVVVRLMRYESLVIGIEGEWDTNYVMAAYRYCNAFDQLFYKNTNTMDPDYELTKGEAAYILAHIMNAVDEGKATTPSQVANPILTADGINLGLKFENVKDAAKASAYYIANLDRVQVTTTTSKVWIGNTSTAGAAQPVYGNAVNTATGVTVTLISADNGNRIVVPAKEFVKALRVELGMAPTPDTMNEEAEINVYDYVNVGTMVNVNVDKDAFVNGVATINNYKDLTGFSINSNSVVVDTYLQAAVSTNANYIGFSAKELVASNQTINSWKPVLPASYDASLATSWTNITYDNVTGKVAAATLNFKGVAYEYGSDITVYAANWAPMTPDEAVNSLINAAQGECYAVFHDVDANGLYDTVYVAKSHAFAYATEANVQPTGPSKANASSGKYAFDILTSLSNGTVVGNMTIAYNNIGSVIFNRTVGYPNNGGMASSDSYNLTVASTGKLQLVLCASNANFMTTSANCVPLYYEVVDLASFYTGIIEEVSAAYVDGYYTARIRCTDDVTRTVYIPVEASTQVKLDVTLGGATAEYTFDSSAWFTFLEDTKDEALKEGIFQDVNVKDPAYLTWAAAWMAGKYVEFSINENNEVICILGTDATTGTTGFVAGVEKTETGDNSYNVTIAATSVANYVEKTQYFNATHPITNAVLYDGKHTYQNNFGGNTIKTTSIVADDGKTYYQSNAASSQLWASTPTVTADTYYVVLDATTGKIYKDADGNYTDSLGHAFIDYENLATYNSVNSVVTTEVRAAASGIFDWANYNVYNQLFKGILLDPNVATDKKVEAGRDLIYVTLMKDAGSNYVLYNAYPTTAETKTTGRTTNFQVGDKAYTANRWYKVQNKSVKAAEASWYGIEDGYILSIAEVAGSKNDTHDAYGNVNGYEALYNAKIGYGAYYERAWNTTSKSYTYELKFTEVKELQNFVGTASAIIDTTKTYMVALHENMNDASSKQVVVDEEWEKVVFTLANGYYVDKDNKVFILVGNTKVTYKTNEKGELITEAVKYDYTTATGTVVTGTDVNFKDKAALGLTSELTPYTVLSLTAKVRGDEGYFPGSYWVSLDGEKYSMNGNNNIVVVTPSAAGFSIAVKTVAELAAEGGYFVTEWNAVIGSGNTVQTLAIVGQKAVAGGSSVVDPEPPVVEDNTRLVYLDKTATAYVKHDQYSNAWLVVSDKSAFALPNGEEIGAIYRSYPTYVEADNAIKIDLGIEGGKWYIVDENNQIVSETNVDLLSGIVTDIKADGTTIATMNGVEKVVISNMKTKYFYYSADKTVINVAEDKTDVTIISASAFEALFATQVATLDKAQKAYDEALAKHTAGNLSDERLAYYADALAAAETALAEAKASNLDKYFNGKFWGFANSPLYKYVAMAQGTFQEGKPTLGFKYVIVDDTLCVFTDSFFFG